MSKRILIYSTAYYPFVGGAEVAIKEITDRLPEYEFEMITARLDKRLPQMETIGRVKVYRLGLGIAKLDKLYLAFAGHFKGLKLHQERPYDLVWGMMASFGGLAALSFKLHSKAPFLLTLQEGDPIPEILKKVSLIKARFKKIFTQADGLQPISHYLNDWGISMGFIGKVKEVVPNGVDVGLFTKDYSPEEINQLRKSFNFPKLAVIIVTASRLVVKNGIGDVIKALVQLPDKFCFYICGTGPLERELKLEVETLGLSERVRFAGMKNHAELGKILKACDIFIRPSLTEGLGNSFLEAMAAGLPTIGTLVGGIPDFLTDGLTGLVCQPQDHASIAQAITRASQLTVEAKLGLYQRAMKIITERYNWEYISARMNYLFNKLIE